MRALFCEIIKAHHYAIILIFLCCFGIYSDFSYFFSQFFQLLGWFLEAVLVIFAVSATFLAIFPAFGLNFILGAVLKDLRITAPQGLPTMLSISCKP